VIAAPPNTRSVNEANSAIWSSERRQKITAATAKKTSTTKTESPTPTYAA
jgi:hypothetical protein